MTASIFLGTNYRSWCVSSNLGRGWRVIQTYY